MTQRELVELTLEQKETPRVPFIVLNGATMICKQNNLSPLGMLRLPDGGAQILVDAYREMGADAMFGAAVLGFPYITVMGGKVEDDAVGCASEIIERPLESVADIDRYDIDDLVEKLKKNDLYLDSQKQVRAMRKLVGDDFHIAVGGFSAFTIASQMVGVDTFLVELMSGEEEHCNKMLRVAAELIMQFNKGMVEAGGDLVIFAEPVASGDLISEEMFEELVLPINAEMSDRCREWGVRTLIHICGNTTPRVAPLSKTSVDAFSVDSIDMVKATEDAEGKMALLGNLSPASILLSMTADEVYEKSMELCREMEGKRGFILAPGCDLSPDTPLENVKAMARAAKATAK